MRMLIDLFLVFLKVGTFTLGGGLAMVPVIKKIVVDEKGWLNSDEMIDCFALSQSLPGVMSINASIYVGNRKKGLLGAFAAAFGMILPAVASILLILIFLGKFENNVYINGAFEGIKAASAALILLTAYNMGKNIIKNKVELFITLCAFVSVVVFNINAIYVIIFGAVCGMFTHLLRFKKGGKNGNAC